MSVSSIEFRLFAPRIERANLTGSFNSWQDIAMSKNDTTGEFITNIDLEDGEYTYKFRILSQNEPNQFIDIIDPYATRVEDEEKGAILKIHKGQRVNGNEYVWKYDGRNLPENRDLIIYEIFIADFTEEGTLRSAMGKLDYLSNELGINCIELMPVQAFLLGHDWGYTTKYFFALEPSYGSSEDLKSFIDECHGRGIRVLIDAVFNHSHTDCPLNFIDRTSWYYEGFHHPEHPEETWGPEFNYDFRDEQHGNIRPALKFIADVMRFWIEEYHIDGIRFDAGKQIDNHEALAHFDSIGHSLRSPFYTIVEYVPATADIVKPRGPMDAVWRNIVPPFVDIFQFPENKSFFNQLMHIGNPFEEDQYLYSTSIVNFWACHDNERFLELLNKIHFSNEEAFHRLAIAAVWLMTSIGIPQIWMGDEWADEQIIGNENRTKEVKKINWSSLTKTSHRSLWDLYRKLISFRRSSVAIRSDNLRFFHHDAEAHILAYHRWTDEPNQSVIVIYNLSIKDQQNYAVRNWPKNGTWKEYFSETNIQIDQSTELQIDLKSYQYQIFVLQE